MMGEAQLENVKTSTQLAASMASFQAEKEVQKDGTRLQKKKDEEQKALKKLESDQKAKAEHDRLLPICKEPVARGIDHVLQLNLNNSSPSEVPSKINILKHALERKEGNSSLRLQRANRLLEDLLHPPPEDDGDALAAALKVSALGGGDGDTRKHNVTRTGRRYEM